MVTMQEHPGNAAAVPRQAIDDLKFFVIISEIYEIAPEYDIFVRCNFTE